MGAVIRDSRVGLKHQLQKEERVGTRRSTECIESYLRKAHDLFHGGKNGKDTVLLLEMFFFYKVGRDNNKVGSGKQAISAICDFLSFTKTPPWRWTPQMLYEYLTDMRTRGIAPSTIRGRHHYIKNMCDAILSDRDIANKIMTRHPGSNFQQITNHKSRALVKGFGKKKRKLVNPTPSEFQQVMDYLESEITEAIETGKPTPYILLRDRALIATFYAYGVRLSELVNADVTDFDYDPECPEYGDLGIWCIIGKGDKDRYLPVTVEWIYPVLSKYIECVRPQWTNDPRTPEKDKNALFFSNTRKRISRTNVQTIISKRFREAGIKKKFSPHRLRNGCLTRLTDEVGLSQASKIAGHSFAATTEGYYDKKASMSGDALSNHVKNIYKRQRESNE